jgi:hypothetical protein
VRGGPVPTLRRIGAGGEGARGSLPGRVAVICCYGTFHIDEGVRMQGTPVRVPREMIDLARTNTEFRDVVGDNDIDPATVIRVALLVFAGIAVKDAVIQALKSHKTG